MTDSVSVVIVMTLTEQMEGNMKNFNKPFDHMGYRIEYSRMQKRWFVCDYDYELGFVDVASKPTKLQAMIWAENQNGVFI